VRGHGFTTKAPRGVAFEAHAKVRNEMLVLVLVVVVVLK
jgi:hypothetical protein